jgi:transposase InsO family protein
MHSVIATHKRTNDEPPRRGPLMTALRTLRRLVRACCVGRATLMAENLALRHQPPAPAPTPLPLSEPVPSARRVTAKRPNHVWHVDLTIVPTGAGFWTSWLPFALPQCWPFCWWLAVVIDHYSRRALGFAVFRKQPTSEQVRPFLGRVMASVAAVPKYVITDSGAQFACAGFKRWCRRHGIRHRQGAVGKQGSIAVVERFIRTLKDGCTRVLSIVPWLRRSFQFELDLFLNWYNQLRSHTTLKGATPDEVYLRHRPGCRAPRFEPRAGWPRASPCAQPHVLVKGQAGVQLSVGVMFVDGRRHLPRIRLTRAA